MSHMFYKCDSLANLNLSNFNTQNVTNIYNMSSLCKSLKKINILTTVRKIIELLEHNNIF